MNLLQKLSKKEKLGLFIGVGFIMLALLDRVIIAPIGARMKKINLEIAMDRKVLEHTLRNVNQKELITKEYEKYASYVKKSASNEAEVARLLGEIEEFARNSNVYLVDTKPYAPKKADFYTEYAVDIEAEGQQESLIKFLYQLSNSSQLLRAEKIRLSLKGKEDSVVKASIVVTKILLSQS